MGKEVYIYEVNFDLLSHHIPGLLNEPDEWSVLRYKVAWATDSLTMRDYHQLLDFLHDHVLSEEHFEAELEELGFKNIQTFHPTYLAVVFMDLLRDLMPEASLYTGLDLYQLTKEDILLFTEVLMLYQELFEQYDDAERARFFDIPLPVREKFTASGKQLLEQEIESRKTLGEAYSGKWFPHYFHFFMGIDPQGIRNAILKGKGDMYLVVDSY